MLKNFEFQTQPLTAKEQQLVQPFIAGLRLKVGKANAVTSEQIKEGIKKNCNAKVDGPRIRKIINHIRLNGLVPGLMATSEGYYIATTPEELDEYIESLSGRVKAIAAVMRSMKDQKAKMFPKYEPLLFQNA